MEYCVDRYHIEIDAVGIAEALLGSVSNFNRHNAMLGEAFLRWIPDTNTFLCQYGELKISL